MKLKRRERRMKGGVNIYNEMKKSIFIVSTIGLIFAGSFSACKEKEPEEEYKNPYRDNIIGQWKLIEVSVCVNYSQPDTTDYSNENIIFDFQENNKLVVSGPIPDVLVIFDDFQEGDHFYEYRKFEPPPTDPAPNLSIDKPELGRADRYYYCNALLGRDTMTIGIFKGIGWVYDETGVVTTGDYYGWSKTFIKLN